MTIHTFPLNEPILADSQLFDESIAISLLVY